MNNNLKMAGGGRASLIDDRKRTKKRRVIATILILMVLVVLVWLSINYLNRTKGDSKKEEAVTNSHGVTDVMTPPTPQPVPLPTPSFPVPLPVDPPAMSPLRIRLVNELDSDQSCRNLTERLRQIGFDQISIEKPWYPRKTSKSLVLYRPGAAGVAEAAASITERLKLDKPISISASLVLGLDFPKHKDLPIKHKNARTEKNTYIELLNGTDQPYISKTKLVGFLLNRRLVVAGDARNYSTDSLKETFVLKGSGESKAAQVLKEMYELPDSAVKEDDTDIIIIVGEGI